MKLIILIVFLLASCSSSVKWSPERDKRIVKQNTTERDISYYDRSGDLDSENLKELRQRDYINNNPAWSCFKDKSSKETNYIELSDKEISFYRIHVLKQEMKNFSQVTTRKKDKVYSLKENSVKDWVTINSQRCLLKIKNGGIYYVVSERYRGGERLWEQ